MSKMRITNHPILGNEEFDNWIDIIVDGKQIKAKKGEMIAAALMANGIRIHRYTTKEHQPRGVYCGIGQCTDCVMTVNGEANVRTCITPIESGMVIETQKGFGRRK